MAALDISYSLLPLMLSTKRKKSLKQADLPYWYEELAGCKYQRPLLLPASFAFQICLSNGSLVLYELHFFIDNFVRGKVTAAKDEEGRCGTASIKKPHRRQSIVWKASVLRDTGVWKWGKDAVS